MFLIIGSRRVAAGLGALGISACLGARAPREVGDLRVGGAAGVEPPVKPEVVAQAPNAAPEPDADADDATLPMHMIAWRDGPLELLVPAVDTVAVIAAPAFALLGADNELHRDPAWLRGLHGVSYHDAFVQGLVVEGGAPTWLVTRTDNQRTDDAHLVFRRDKDRWERVRNESGDVSWHHEVITPWRGGHLALRTNAPNPDAGMLYEDDDIDRVHRDAVMRRVARRPRRFEVPGGGAAPGPLPRLPRDLAVQEFIALPTGDVLAIVGVTAVARWRVGQTRHTLEPLPDVGEWPELHLAPGTDPGTALVYGSPGRPWEEPYLASDAGGAWTAVATASGEPILSLAAGPDGLLWAVHGEQHFGDGNQLWRRAAGEWQRAELAPVRFADEDPDRAARAWPVVPRHVHLRSDDDLWLIGTTAAYDEIDLARPSGRYVVLRGRPAAQVLELPGPASLRGEAMEWMEVAPWRPGSKPPVAQRYPPTTRNRTEKDPDEGRCTRVFVQLAEPSPAEEQRIVALVPGLGVKHTLTVDLAEVSYLGRRLLGAYVVVPRGRDAAVAAFLADVERASPGPRPVARCHAPRFIRDFGPPGVRPPEPPRPAHVDPLIGLE